ncbi:Adenosine 3'-phospho 5'-phosphosulfate transporter 2 [Seminavis robusta]|uniref:Adenosine 3'-phospho 5'-phosphosulfate transporter 2 n=1 Tax=Seminavis robusta TaxID=568900 RepID=A0A9N8H7G5_9STRA|nr:Adenosine 3'-phospho 5'-phosphosulfate transporter 2 [Seminavis robusta]|eukprot:Sro203_g085720.1 Adenosine 3'-phospho 5'-phosphosulfate transporter 2 (368) ;mRNA; f:86591-87694
MIKQRSPKNHNDDISQELTEVSIEEGKPTSPLQSSIQQHPFPLQLKICIYASVFFGAMIVHEVALEAAAYSFGHLDALASAVTFVQFLFCVIFPLSISRGKGLQDLPKTVKKLMPYTRLSLLVFCAAGMASRSVRYVTYPTKVIFKASRLIPTMLVAGMWQGERYTPLEYLSAFLLCAGAAGYAYGSGRDATGDNSTPHAENWGIFLLINSVICDAVVPNYQKMLLNQGVSPTQLMINVNTVGTIAALLYLCLTGQLFPILAACQAHPQLLFDLVCVGVGVSIAVWAYTNLLEATSSVVAVGVATVRKFATVALSYFLFPKPLPTNHIFAAGLVFGGLALSTVAAKDRNIIGPPKVFQLKLPQPTNS